jgi:hypothetical protein
MRQTQSMLAVNNDARLPPHLGPRLLLVALCIGVAADLLLRATPWGVNLLATTAVVVVAGVLLCRWGGIALEGEGRWLVVPVLFFSAALAWRDSPTLNAANAVALLAAAGFAALTSRAGQVRLAGVSQYATGLAYVLGYAMAGLLPTLHGEIEWRRWRWRWWSTPVLAAGRGVVLAIPPLLVFGGLFMSADANFEKLVRELLNFNAADALIHLGLMLVYAWLIGGTLHEMLIAPLRPRVWLERPGGVRLNIVEVSVVLSALNALFATFVVVQLPYLFGGVVQVAQLGYSDYARRGFFELVWVAGLTLPFLLWTHWLVRGSGPLGSRVYGSLAFGLVCLVLLVMASAVQRMQLYVADLGITELRLQASIFMGWLTIVLGWFVITVLRGQRRRFAFGALASALIVIAGLDFANPDAVIVRTNAHFLHLEGEAGFDERPLASLSADATPAIVEALPLLSPQGQRITVQRLRSRYTFDSRDWRTFNMSRDQAHEAVATIAPH